MLPSIISGGAVWTQHGLSIQCEKHIYDFISKSRKTLEHAGKRQAGKSQDVLYRTTWCCPLDRHLGKKGEQSAEATPQRFLLSTPRADVRAEPRRVKPARARGAATTAAVAADPPAPPSRRSASRTRVQTSLRTRSHVTSPNGLQPPAACQVHSAARVWKRGPGWGQEAPPAAAGAGAPGEAPWVRSGGASAQARAGTP